MIIKRTVALIGLLVAMLILLTGCSNGAKEQDNETPVPKGKAESHLYDHWNEKCKVIRRFYKAYSKKDYTKMKLYLTEEGKASFNKWIKANPRAKLKMISKKDSIEKDGELCICTFIDAECTEYSPLWNPEHPVVKDYPSYHKVTFINGKWLVSFVDVFG